MSPGGLFAHQAGLRQQVEALLAAPPPAHRPEFSIGVPAPAASPVLPAGTIKVKKTDLALLAGPLRVVAAVAASGRSEPGLRPPSAPVAEVPHPPPRPSRPV